MPGDFIEGLTDFCLSVMTGFRYNGLSQGERFVYVIALAQQKGGVGKSTVAIQVAVELNRRKRRAAVIDLDPQASVVKWGERRKREEPIVMPSNGPSLAGSLVHLRGNGVEFAFLDLPGRNSPLTNDGMRAANLVLVPARPDEMDIEASGETVAAAQRLRRRYMYVMSLAPSRRSDRTGEFAKALVEHGHPVFPVHLIDRIAYSDSVDRGLGVTEMEPRGQAAKEIGKFTTALLDVLEELTRHEQST